MNLGKCENGHLHEYPAEAVRPSGTRVHVPLSRFNCAIKGCPSQTVTKVLKSSSEGRDFYAHLRQATREGKKLSEAERALSDKQRAEKERIQQLISDSLKQGEERAKEQGRNEDIGGFAGILVGAMKAIAECPTCGPGVFRTPVDDAWSALFCHKCKGYWERQAA